MDIHRAFRRYRALLASSAGLGGKAKATRTMFYYTADRLNLWKKSKLIELKVAGYRFEIDMGRKELASILEVLLERCYEPDPEWVTSPGEIVFDIGSNIGVFSVLQAAQVAPGRVYAFEPSPTTYVRLERNVALNGSHNVETFPHALGGRNGWVRFVDKPISLNSYVSERPTDVPTVGVAMKTLDDFVTTRGIGRIDLMKIDTEGHEIPILSGGRRALEGTRRLVVEIHRPDDEKPIREMLEKAGLQCVRQQGDVLFFRR